MVESKCDPLTYICYVGLAAQYLMNWGLRLSDQLHISRKSHFIALETH